MVCALYKSIFAMLAVIAAGSTDASVGVCYAPWHHEVVDEVTLTTDVTIMSQYFGYFRTFETLMGGINIIRVAASVGMQVIVGVQMNDMKNVNAEIEAVCQGYKENPQAVLSVMVGNENLQNGDFGTVSAEVLVRYIKMVQECTGHSVPVGSAQRMTEWTNAEGAAAVYAASTRVGVNIYSFFTAGPQTPIEKFQAQWTELTSQYGSGNKFLASETGWPTSGEASFDNLPSLQVAQQYLIDVVAFAQGSFDLCYFMMFDSTFSYTTAEYEKHFGLFTSTGVPKLTIPPNLGGKPGLLTNTSNIVPGAPAPEFRLGQPLSRTPEAEPPMSGNPQDTPSAYGPTPSVDGPTPSVDGPTPSVDGPTPVQDGKNCAM